MRFENRLLSENGFNKTTLTVVSSPLEDEVCGEQSALC